MKSRSFLASLRFAVAGLASLVRTERNARIHVAVAVLVAAAAFLLRVSWTDAALLALAIGLVMAAEAFNTAIETLTDLASPNPHPLARTAKDVAAAGVLLTAFSALAVGIFVLGPPVWGLIFSAENQP